jgi:hypothetical protein
MATLFPEGDHIQEVAKRPSSRTCFGVSGRPSTGIETHENGGDRTVEDSWHRMARALSTVEPRDQDL